MIVGTYRLQLTPAFGLREAAAQVDYLAALGVSHLYLSPITEARPGSTHGYDVVDHNRVREELGGEEAFELLRARCVEAGLGLVLDFVPNHAGIGAANEAWQDVLAYGRASPSADTFDLELDAGAKILLPFLGRHYGEALDEGELSIVLEHGRLAAAYYEQRYAMRPESYRAVLERVLPHASGDRGALAALLADYVRLGEGDRARAEELRARFAALDGAIAEALAALDRAEVHALLEAQRWRLAYWKTAGAEVSYRRFFDINDLAGLRMEVPAVFEQAHAKLRELLAREGVDGARIDHVDGLYDPAGYLARLRELGAEHVWVEKILAPREGLPERWPVEGTTGYEAMNDILRVLVFRGGEGPLTRLWHRVAGVPESWDEHVHACKRLVMRTSLSGELRRLAGELVGMCRADYHTRDYTRPDLTEALAEVIAALGRYRTYLPDARAEDIEAVRDAVALARHRNPAMDPSVFDLVGRAILGPFPDALEARRQLWVGRLQQYTAPVAAKGVEDTALYRDHRLIALNEVGGEPDRFSLDPAAFSSRARHRAKTHPRALTATATHDHKRGEDVRARLALLSELHREWARLARELADLGARHRSPVGPSAADAYLLHQTLAALWGTDDRASLSERLVEYATKAARESKERTSWIHPDEAYEGALRRYVGAMLEDEAAVAALAPFAETLARLGFTHTITQVILRHTIPGVPDLYQGCELLDLSLVDPDNRREVDYARRRAILSELRPLIERPEPEAVRALADARDARFKLYVIARLLRARREHPALFLEAPHRGLRVERHTLAFARRLRERALVVIVPRLLVRRSPDAVHARVRPVPRGDYRDVISGARVRSEGELVLGALGQPWSVLLRE